MDFIELCEKIGLPREVIACLPQQAEAPSRLLHGLTVPKTAQAAFQQLNQMCDPSQRGLDMLAWMLRAGLMTWENYGCAGLGEEIFVDTMKCFNRFVREHRDSFGVYGFDRGFWAHRQLSMVLFRVGQLEYELLDGVVSMHIPSDTDLHISACADSLNRFRETFPDRAKDPIFVDSWLLSPALRQLLGPDSRILAFQNCFTCEQWDQEQPGFMQWVYGREGIPSAQLPENTSLQRNMKKYLLAGGKIGEARGFLKEFK